jgi:predicted nucleic acid-binding Zn finger protein
MSCITEILKAKGDKEYLIADDIIIESGGIYKSYEWLVTFTSVGHRCGYVALPEDHKLYAEAIEKGYDNDYVVHGGITFVNQGKHIINRVLKGRHCTDLWLGFDAAHCYDAKDFISAKKYFSDSEVKDDKFLVVICELEKMCISDNYYQEETAEIRTNKYMEDQCKSLIDQIIERAA